MKGGGVSANQSKKIKPEKATYRDLFVALWKIKSQLENISVKDAKRRPYPVMHLFMMTEGYIPQSTDCIKAQSSGGNSLKNFRVDELLQNRLSWEAQGIAKGKLPSTMIVDQNGDERYPFMTMNGIIIDENSSEYRNRTILWTKFIHSAPKVRFPYWIRSRPFRFGCKINCLRICQGLMRKSKLIAQSLYGTTKKLCP